MDDDYRTPDLDDLEMTGLDAMLGITVAQAGPDRVVLEWDVRPQHHQPHGIVHGGVYCTAVETAASIGAMLWYVQKYANGGTVVGVSNQTDFLRSVVDGHLTATGTPVHRGRSQQLWLVEIADEQGRLVARGQVRLQNLGVT